MHLILLPATNQVSFPHLVNYALVKHLQNALYHSVSVSIAFPKSFCWITGKGSDVMLANCTTQRTFIFSHFLLGNGRQKFGSLQPWDLSITQRMWFLLEATVRNTYKILPSSLNVKDRLSFIGFPCHAVDLIKRTSQLQYACAEQTWDTTQVFKLQLVLFIKVLLAGNIFKSKRLLVCR